MKPSLGISGFLSAAVLVLSLPRLARSDEPTAVREEQNVQAVLVGRAALEAYHRADWTTALEAFSRAETMSHSPVFLLYIARCRRNLGAWLEALDLYHRVISERLDPTAPEPWRMALRDAARELEELKARLPTIVIIPENAPPNATFWVDGKPVDPRALGVQIQVNPGVHRIMGTDPTGAKVEFELRVEPSERARQVAVRFASPEPRPGVSSVRPPIASERAATELPAAHPTRRAAYVSGALGLVGVTIGAVAGVVALVKTDSLKARCQDNLCLSRDRAEADSIRPYTSVATLGFALGGVALATGTVLLALDPPWGRQSARAPFVVQLGGTF